jgi:Fe-S-cluster containining protein
LQDKIKAVEEVFDELGKEISAFQKQTKLGCVTGCGACCKKPHIEATPLEFLPFAYHLYKIGKAENVLEKLNNNPGNTCIIFKAFPEQNTNAGTCTEYKYRGLICRLFGFSASLDKHGKSELSTCKIIKETQAENYTNAVTQITEGLSIPVMRDYYFKLRSVDANLSDKFYPINIAIKEAIEHVLMYYAYR